MPFTIPDNDVAGVPARQSPWYSTDIAILVAGFLGTGVLTGCDVTAQGSPNMTLAVASGTIQPSAGVGAVTVAAGNVTITTAHATLPRIDLVTAAADGTKTVTAGTAAAEPKPPGLPSGHIALAMVDVPAADTAIQTAQITSKRVIVFAASGGGALTVKDEGTPLATDATSLDFVGAGVVASGTGAAKTITIAGGGNVATDAIWDAAGDLAVGSGADTAAKLTKGADGQVLTVDPTTHLLIWATPAGGALTTKGDILGYSTAAARIPVGSDTQVLTADSTQAFGLKWAAGGGGGSDLVQVASGAGSIIIPGLSASADIRVAGANDDEFDTTDTSDPMTGWTTLGTPSAHDINSTAKSHYYVRRNAASGDGLVGIYKACPSIPFTVTCKLTDCYLGAAYNLAGLAILEASPGKIMTLNRNYSAGSPWRIGGDKYTNRTTNAGSPPWTAVSMFGILYLRLVVNSTTSVDAYFSQSGLSWTLMGNANPGFTPGAVGLLCDSNNASHKGEAFFDWIRFS
jgi:hypothetical protein